MQTLNVLRSALDVCRINVLYCSLTTYCGWKHKSVLTFKTVYSYIIIIIIIIILCILQRTPKNCSRLFRGGMTQTSSSTRSFRLLNHSRNVLLSFRIRTVHKTLRNVRLNHISFLVFSSFYLFIYLFLNDSSASTYLLIC